MAKLEPVYYMCLIVMVDACLRYGQDLSRNVEDSFIHRPSNASRRRYVEPRPRTRSHHDVYLEVSQEQRWVSDPRIEQI